MATMESNEAINKIPGLPGWAKATLGVAGAVAAGSVANTVAGWGMGGDHPGRAAAVGGVAGGVVGGGVLGYRKWGGLLGKVATAK